jgi:hypothetical protein
MYPLYFLSCFLLRNHLHYPEFLEEFNARMYSKVLKQCCSRSTISSFFSHFPSPQFWDPCDYSELTLKIQNKFPVEGRSLNATCNCKVLGLTWTPLWGHGSVYHTHLTQWLSGSVRSSYHSGRMVLSAVGTGDGDADAEFFFFKSRHFLDWGCSSVVGYLPTM